MSFFGVLKYNSVFVTDESLDILQEQGFGAKRLRPVDNRILPNPVRRISKKRQQEIADKLKAEVELTQNEGIIAEESTKLLSTETISECTSSAIVAPIPPVNSAPMLLFDEELWQKFLQKNQKFPIKYKVYSFFRDKGFVVKTGVHYGLDYAVYRTLPTHCHSEICAMVVDATKPLNLSSIVVDSSHAEENSEERVEAVAEDFEPSKCQQGWRHISTLTRVMPDVMKLLTLCYVLPTIPMETFPPRAEPGSEGIIDNAPSNLEDSISDPSAPLVASSSSSSSRQSAVETVFDYRSLFADELTYAHSNSSSGSDEVGECMSNIDFSSSSCLSMLSVRPVSVMVRRLPAKGETYRSVGEMQLKYRSCSILKVPRQSIMACSAAGVRSEGSGGGVSALMKKKRKKRRDHTELRTKQHTKHNKMWKSLMTPLAMPLTGSSKAVEDSIARQAALGSARMNTAEAILKREKRKMKNLGGFDADINEAMDFVHCEEIHGTEDQVKRARTDTDILPTVSVGAKGSDNRREMLAAAGRAAAKAAIAAAAAVHNASCTVHDS